jgi:hypothetical protein
MYRSSRPRHTWPKRRARLNVIRVTRFRTGWQSGNGTFIGLPAFRPLPTESSCIGYDCGLPDADVPTRDSSSPQPSFDSLRCADTSPLIAGTMRLSPDRKLRSVPIWDRGGAPHANLLLSACLARVRQTNGESSNDLRLSPAAMPPPNAPQTEAPARQWEQGSWVLNRVSELGTAFRGGIGWTAVTRELVVAPHPFDLPGTLQGSQLGTRAAGRAVTFPTRLRYFAPAPRRAARFGHVSVTDHGPCTGCPNARQQALPDIVRNVRTRSRHVPRPPSAR